jgi:CheY-like chemotaxis protein
MMPGMNGTELADAVVKRLPKVRVLFMTGYTDQDIEKIGFKHPGSQVLHKPFRLETLAQKVREALDLTR